MKQIVEEAANKYTDGKCEERGVPKKYRLHFDFDRQDIECAFLAGAEWRINSIWHDNTNIPDDNKFCVFTLSDGNCGCGYYHKKDNTIWYENFSDIVRWAYFEDIKPNMEN